MMNPTDSLAEALAEFRGLPVVLETGGRPRYTLDPESSPYAHQGVLVVPIVEDES